MMNVKEFVPLISLIAEEKKLSFEKTKEIVEFAIAAAYKKEYAEKFQTIRCKIDIENKKIDFWQVKTVVDKKMIYTDEEIEMKKEGTLTEEITDSEPDKKVFFNEEKHIMLKDAKKINKNFKVGDEVLFELEKKEEYGRIAAQSAKQVILQKIKEAEKEIVFEEYKNKEGGIVSGIVQRYDGQNIIFDLGKTLALLPKEEQIYNENYKIGERFKLYILKVEEDIKGYFIILSRSSPKLIERLFEMEVPEIGSGQIEVKAIAREAGNRTKIAFNKKDKDIDVIGSVVGPKGIRIMAVVDEFKNEKIDVIRYSDDIEEFIKNALSPARVESIKIKEPKTAEVIVPFDQISLAIGREGQNVRLASKLTGWKIDVKQGEKRENSVEKEDDGQVFQKTEN